MHFALQSDQHGIDIISWIVFVEGYCFFREQTCRFTFI